jgi:hypothetical protein
MKWDSWGTWIWIWINFLVGWTNDSIEGTEICVLLFCNVDEPTDRSNQANDKTETWLSEWGKLAASSCRQRDYYSLHNRNASEQQHGALNMLSRNQNAKEQLHSSAFEMHSFLTQWPQVSLGTVGTFMHVFDLLLLSLRFSFFILSYFPYVSLFHFLFCQPYFLRSLINFFNSFLLPSSVLFSTVFLPFFAFPFSLVLFLLFFTYLFLSILHSLFLHFFLTCLQLFFLCNFLAPTDLLFSLALSYIP